MHRPCLGAIATEAAARAPAVRSDSWAVFRRALRSRAVLAAAAASWALNFGFYMLLNGTLALGCANIFLFAVLLSTKETQRMLHNYCSSI